MVILHAFEETSKGARKEHLNRYFGIAKDGFDDPHDDGSFVVCYCGGRLVPIGKNNEDQQLSAVWHSHVIGSYPIKDNTDGE